MDASLTYFKAYRTPDAIELWKHHRCAFFLLYVIALRARRTTSFNADGLRPGEAMIGDYIGCGMTEREYRTAKSVLERHGFATFKTTNKGTIATLVNTGVFDINAETDDDQTDGQTTSKRRADDGQTTTNKNVKNGRMENGKKTTKTAARTAARPVLDRNGSLTGLEKPESGDAVVWYAKSCGYENADAHKKANRFIKVNNEHGWKLRDWRLAFDKFAQLMDETG